MVGIFLNSYPNNIPDQNGVFLKLIETGIEELDALLGGGLEENKTFLIAGEPGTGKTILCLQYLYAGLKKGESVTYVAVNEKPEDLLGDAKAMGWDLDQYVKNKMLIILDTSPYIAKTYEGESFNVGRMLADLVKYLRTNNSKRLVIESIDFMASHAGETAKKSEEYLRELILSISHNTRCTTLLTCSIRRDSKKICEFEIVEQMVNGIILLGKNNEGDLGLLSIIKMRQANPNLSKCIYTIKQRQGIVIKTLGIQNDKLLLVGKTIPYFSIEAYYNTKITKLRSSDYAGKWLVIVFYPGDFTFVCPTELEAIADRYGDFKALGAEVLSISMDSVDDHKAWHNTSPAINKIKYPMGSDPTGRVYKLFGIYTEERGAALRATFIFDPEGLLRALEIHDTQVGRNTSETLRKLAALEYVRQHPDELCPANWEPGKPTIKIR